MQGHWEEVNLKFHIPSHHCKWKCLNNLLILVYVQNTYSEPEAGSVNICYVDSFRDCKKSKPSQHVCHGVTHKLWEMLLCLSKCLPSTLDVSTVLEGINNTRSTKCRGNSWRLDGSSSFTFCKKGKHSRASDYEGLREPQTAYWAEPKLVSRKGHNH